MQSTWRVHMLNSVYFDLCFLTWVILCPRGHLVRSDSMVECHTWGSGCY